MSNKLLYISDHAILEFDELTLFTELGFDCFSLGAYVDPQGHHALPRPAIKGMIPKPDLMEESTKWPRTEMPKEFIDQFDVIVIMHSPEVLFQNWDNMKHKRVVWRSIGQSVPIIEDRIRKLMKQGLQVVRYSPMESGIPRYAGENAMIRFYKDPNEFDNWNGKDEKVINISQSLKGRREFCRYEQIMEVGKGFPFKVYGTGNEDLGEFNGGYLTYDFMKGQLRDSRVYLYGGTWPASYTLGFIEAMMTGTPVVSVGPVAGDLNNKDNIATFEIHRIIENGVSGYWSNDLKSMRGAVQLMLSNKELASGISKAGRLKAIELFGKPAIKAQWKGFLQ